MGNCVFTLMDGKGRVRMGVFFFSNFDQVSQIYFSMATAFGLINTYLRLLFAGVASSKD